MKIWVPEVVSAYQVGISSGFSRDFVSSYQVGHPSLLRSPFPLRNQGWEADALHYWHAPPPTWIRQLR